MEEIQIVNNIIYAKIGVEISSSTFFKGDLPQFQMIDMRCISSLSHYHSYLLHHLQIRTN